MSRLIAATLLCLSPVLASAKPFTAFADGETFVYRVGFALFGHAGDITISAHYLQRDGRKVVQVVTETRSNGIVRAFYAFDNRAEVLIDRETGRLISVKQSGSDPKRATDSETTFDYSKRVMHHVDNVRTERSGDVPIPEGDPLDLISVLVQTRYWDLKPGEKTDVLVQFERDLYPLTIRAEGYEEVRTPLGKYHTLMLIPFMQGEPKGLFKRGGEIRVWIAQDQAKLPVKMQLVLKYGAASLLLSRYEPGTPPPEP